jgi:hypothetical protein
MATKTTKADADASSKPVTTVTKTSKNEPDLQPTEAQKGALQPTDTSETRLFQTGNASFADGREPLTKEQARARGFHWLDTDEEAKAKK